MGLSGMITTSANGFERRWTEPGDVAEQFSMYFRDAWFPLDQFTYQQMQTNDAVASAVIRSMAEQIAAGGVLYEPVRMGSDPQVSPPIPKFNTNLLYI
jgi:hypothetical protein